MSARTWGKLTLGTLLIGGILAGLWAVYGPRDAEPLPAPPPPPRLADADAVVLVRDGAGTWRASISCDGERTGASGFWAGETVRACDALAATRGALLSGPGCTRIGRRRVGIAATGAFGARRFAHRAVRGGCPDPDGWLAVNALAAPVLEPDQELEGRGWLTGRTSGLVPWAWEYFPRTSRRPPASTRQSIPTSACSRVSSRSSARRRHCSSSQPTSARRTSTTGSARSAASWTGSGSA